ncbi:MAG TPA: heavy-metal-associated domain-containing protein [Gaiellales bacterium]|nr:heavy-metal-associated domain-containing protein [Gaiellales bacterium]
MTAAQTEVVPVRGMHCGGCERAISQAVRSVPGVGSARADFVAEEVEVTFDPGRTDLDAIRAAVRDAGFTPA